MRLTLTSDRVVGNPMEPKAALARWDGEVLDLWTSTQGMAALRDSLAAQTGLPPERIRVRAQDVGGGFGIRGPAYPEHAALALAARRSGRPVKWVASRSRDLPVSDYHGRGLVMTGELALDAEGQFLAIRHEWLADQGAYPVATGPADQHAEPGDDVRPAAIASPRCTAAIAWRSPIPCRSPPIAAPAGPTWPTSSSAWWTRPRARPASTGSSCAGAT